LPLCMMALDSHDWRNPIMNTEEKTLKKRTGQAYSNHRSRAKKFAETLDYTLAELRTMVAGSVYRPCPYCHVGLYPETFSLDHRMPTSRGGKHQLPNLVVCCQPCNELKGNMDEEEYTLFLDVIRKLAPVAQANLIRRIRSGGKHLFRK
jgi:5-methylcytosine-specific restriction endonuclease McrA